MARLTAGWFSFGVALIAMIGLRDRVGGDWFNYPATSKKRPAWSSRR
ncbi:hypothetical protein HK414_09850 [Ramlibacter terrae]|uniref:Uncharacterized protein n=1 Tax=Ramlibacter terrae TaxID=2732511 RepID=A0ABX6P1Z7_9BURK|nr:hypothetical protein HK414_09850 [Ramlibacter terrae]